MKLLTTKVLIVVIIIIIIIIIKLPISKLISRVHIQLTQWLAYLREPAFHYHKVKIKHLLYEVLYFHMKLNILKCISEKYSIKLSRFNWLYIIQYIISFEKDKRERFYRRMFSHNYEQEHNPLPNPNLFLQGTVLCQCFAIIRSEHCTSTTEVAPSCIPAYVCVILVYDVTRV